MKLKKKLFFILFLLSFISACGGRVESGKEDGLLNVYTTMYPLQFFAEQIGGQFVLVENIVPVGADVHTFEPTAKTMTKVAEGDLFIYNGAGMDGFVDAFVSVLEKEKVHIVKATEGISLRHADEHDHDHNHDHEHGDIDPHVWLDPVLAIAMAENIKNALIDLLPDEKETFAANFLELKNELEKIDAEILQMVKESQKNEFLVSHGAYGYWQDRYGIKQISVTGLSPTNEPSVKQMEELIKKAEQIGVRYIAFEKNLPVKVAETIQKEANLEVVYLNNLETLTEEDVKNGEDYFSLMRKNIESLRLLLK